MSDQNPTLIVECSTTMEFEAAAAAQEEAQTAFKDPNHGDQTRVDLHIVIIGTRVVSCSRNITHQREKYVKRFDRARLRTSS